MWELLCRSYLSCAVVCFACVLCADDYSVYYAMESLGTTIYSAPDD